MNSQEQIEAELIAARLFRYKTRRGLGVFYSLIAIMSVLGTILYLTVPILFVISGLVAGYLTVYIVARFSGFECMMASAAVNFFLCGAESKSTIDGFLWLLEP